MSNHPYSSPKPNEQQPYRPEQVPSSPPGQGETRPGQNYPQSGQAPTAHPGQPYQQSGQAPTPQPGQPYQQPAQAPSTQPGQSSSQPGPVPYPGQAFPQQGAGHIPTGYNPMPGTPPAPGGAKKKRIIIIAVITAVVVALVLVGTLVLFKPSKGGADTPEEAVKDFMETALNKDWEGSCRLMSPKMRKLLLLEAKTTLDEAGANELSDSERNTLQGDKQNLHQLPNNTTFEDESSDNYLSECVKYLPMGDPPDPITQEDLDSAQCSSSADENASEAEVDCLFRGRDYDVPTVKIDGRWYVAG